MSDKSTALIRTAVPSAWASVIVWAVGHFGLDLSDQAWQAVVLLLPVVTGILYRAAREIEVRWPTVGRVLLGSSRQPVYGASTALPD